MLPLSGVLYFRGIMAIGNGHSSHRNGLSGSIGIVGNRANVPYITGSSPLPQELCIVFQRIVDYKVPYRFMPGDWTGRANAVPFFTK